MTGRQLQAWRTALGWTQDTLAAELGVTGATISRWERGVVPITDRTRRHLVALCQRRRITQPKGV